MKRIIRIEDYKMVLGSDKEVMYKDIYSGWFIGPRYDVVIGEKYIVEISVVTGKDGYNRISNFVGRLKG
jgi:hypothetical protein